MSSEAVPTEIRDFINRSIDSIAQLEALLLVRANATETWNAEKIATRLYVDRSEIKKHLDQLCQSGLLIFSSGFYEFGGVSEVNRRLVDMLAAVYAHQLIAVTNLIHAKPRIQEFADAFKLRKDG